MHRRWPAFAAREAVLADLERAIAANPSALDARFYYASFLRDHGRFDDAIVQFEAVLGVAPAHVETLVALGVVLTHRGRRLDARAAFERALAADANHYAANVNLANALALDDAPRAEALYRHALALDDKHAPAHRGLCSIAAMRGDVAAAARHRAAGYATGPFARRPYFGELMPRSVLALVSTDGGNIPLDALLDPRVFAVTELFVEAYRDEPLPPHELVVNAIADAERGAAALPLAAYLADRSRTRVINAPRAVAATSRVENARRLRACGVITPEATWLRENAEPDAFPLIVRVPGLHMGRGMRRVDDQAALARAIDELGPRNDLLAIRYVDTRSSDGAWRKYRVMAIGGVLYPLHLAIAQRWDVHYFSSANAERADYRAEEARFLRDPVAALGSRAWDALRGVGAMLGLDYAGIDFALDADGRVVMFEANAAMTVLAPDPDQRFRYREAAVERITRALRRLFEPVPSGQFVVDVADQEDDRYAAEDERDAGGHDERQQETAVGRDQEAGDHRCERAADVAAEIVERRQ